MSKTSEKQPRFDNEILLKNKFKHVKNRAKIETKSEKKGSRYTMKFRWASRLRKKDPREGYLRGTLGVP